MKNLNKGKRNWEKRLFWKQVDLEAQKLKLKVELQAERKSVVNFEKSYVSHSKMTNELALKVEKEKKLSLIL